MTQDTEEHRRVGRVRTILGAHAIIGKGLPDVACQVKDLSDTGARIAVDDQVFLPDQFEFRVPKRGVSHAARVRWRRGGVVGIEFLPDNPASTDLVGRVRELEAENAELRRRVAEMADRLFSYGDSERFGKGDTY